MLVYNSADIVDRGGEIVSNKKRGDSHRIAAQVIPEIGQFRQLIHMSPDMIAIHSRGVIAYMNPAGIRMLGYKKAVDVIGRPISQFLHPDDRPIVSDMLKDLYSGEERRQGFRFRFMRPDGTSIYLEISSAPISRADPESRQVLARDITEKVKAEETLRASEELFRLFVQGVKGYAMYTTDRQGIITSWNLGAQRLKGYRKSEILGKHFSIFFLPEAIADGRPQVLLRKAEKEGQVEAEGWRVRKDGSCFWAGTLLTAMRDSNGRLKGFSKITRDLTDEKSATDRLIKEVQQLQGVFDRSNAVMFLKDTSGKYIRVNGQFERSFGMKAAAILGKTDREVFPPDQAREFEENDKKVIESRVPLVFEETARYGDGIHTGLVVKYPLTDERRAIYATGGVVTDITHLKKNEELLRSINRKLEAVLNAVPLAILTVDSKGRIISWNRGAEQMFGWTKEEATGKVFPAVPPSGLRGYLDAIGRGFKGESLAGHIRERRKKDGMTINASIAYAPVMDCDGRIESVIVVIDDVTERTRAEKELEQSHEKLRNMSRRLESIREQEKKKIALEIHDELGQMLTALKMDLSVMHEGLLNEEHASRSEMTRQLVSAVRLIDSAIDTVRRIAADLRPGILDHLGLEAAVSDLAKSFEKRAGIACRLKMRLGDTKLGQEESIALYRIVQESLTNVARHSKATIVSIRADRKDGVLSVEIFDNGKGITNSQVSSHASLGIFGMRERAEAIGASFSVGSGKGGGTVVRIRLPIKGTWSSITPLTKRN